MKDAIMADTPVNIGDFRCRGGRSRVAPTSAKDDDRPRGIMLVPVEAQPERESVREALVADNPPVFDIAIAREATQVRHRIVVRPIPMQRRHAQIVRISEPRVAVMRIHGEHGHERRVALNDDCDLPPAA
jgi:hypothetical protein